MSRLTPACLATCALILSVASAAADSRDRYDARFADGSRMEGNALTDWHKLDVKPKLEGRELFASDNPMLWLHDRSLRPSDPPVAFVEMIGGDRLPGVVQGYRPAGLVDARSLPAHFVVRPETNFNHPDDSGNSEVLVVERFVRRIVWQRRRGLADRYEPGTVDFRDGRSARFRVARFDASGVRLLLDDGTRRVGYGEIAELHLPLKDPWPSYYDELATLDPTLEARLLQVETTDGLRATGAMNRFDAREGPQGKDNERWLHALQPAWALRLLWIPHRTVFAYRSFAAHQVPLSRIFPVEAALSGMFGGGSWHWQVNRNTQGGRQRCGGHAAGWGLGVHAFAELHFPLPPLVQSFRSSFGLDDSVGSGGCVRARVYAGSTKASPLYESQPIVGSATLHETGSLSLDAAKQRLILQVDPMHEGRPAGADPLDIRDVCNWVDPVLELDLAALRREVANRVIGTVPAWEGWEVSVPADGSLRAANFYEKEGRERGVFLTELAAEKQPFSLRRTMQVEPQHRWLLIGASVRGNYGDKIKLELRVAGEPMAVHSVPDGGARDSVMIAFPVHRFAGQRVSFELTQLLGDGRLNVWWRALALVDQLPNIYRAFDDQGEFVSLEPTKTATLIDSDHYSGEKSAKLPAGGSYRFAFDAPLRLGGDSAVGNYRLLRLAIRKAGGGRVGIEFEPVIGESRKIIDMGKGPPVAEKAKRVHHEELTDEWMPLTRDLINDVGERDVTGMIVHVPDGEYALIDHVHFVRSHDDLRWLPPEPPSNLTKAAERQKAIDEIRPRAEKAMVRLDVEGRKASGALIGGDWLVLTAGHVLAGPNRAVRVTLSDGREVAGKTAGIDRTSNLGLVKLDENPNIGGLDIRDWQNGQDRNLYLAWRHDPADPSKAASMAPMRIDRAFYDTIWGETVLGDALIGSPLVNWEGCVVGVQTRRSRFGGTLYSKARPVQENWEKLKRGEVWGEWLRGAGPSLGVSFAGGAEGCRVAEVTADAAAAVFAVGDVVEKFEQYAVSRPAEIDALLATKNPGDEVSLEVTSAKSRRAVKATVQPRRW
jgi:S1-C subfamily serine protease